MSESLSEEQLHRFLRRRRHKGRELTPPPLHLWLTETLDICTQLIGTKQVLVYLNDPTVSRRQSKLTIIAASSPEESKLLGRTFDQTAGYAGWVFQNKELFHLERGLLRKASKVEDALPELGSKSVIATPLFLEKTIAGVLELRDKVGHTGFSNRDQTLAGLLAHYLSRAILNAIDILKQQHIALHDNLTGLRNSRGLEETLNQSLRTLRRSEDLGVIFVDIDKLKWINDELGHQAGSEAIRRAASAIEEVLADRGTAFRFGGDEFVVILPRHDVTATFKCAKELRKGVLRKTQGQLPQGGYLPPVSTSLGVATLRTALLPQATLPPGMEQPQRSRSARLLGAADRALYRAKAAGRDRAEIATQDDDPVAQARPSAEWLAMVEETTKGTKF